MNRQPEQTVFQRRHAEGQQVQEKMCDITNLWRSVNQNYNEMSPDTRHNG